MKKLILIAVVIVFYGCSKKSQNDTHPVVKPPSLVGTWQEVDNEASYTWYEDVNGIQTKEDGIWYNPYTSSMFQTYVFVSNNTVTKSEQLDSQTGTGKSYIEYNGQFELQEIGTSGQFNLLIDKNPILNETFSLVGTTVTGIPGLTPLIETWKIYSVSDSTLDLQRKALLEVMPGQSDTVTFVEVYKRKN